MAEVSFTPGPWRAMPYSDDVIEANCVLINSPISGDVAEVISLDVGKETALINAHLIAAAPELYRNLEMAAKQFRKYEALHRAKDTDDGRKKANSNMMFAQLCEWALAEARGEPKRSATAPAALESDGVEQ